MTSVVERADLACANSGPRGCRHNATVIRFCNVEGVQIALCAPHDAEWKETAKRDPQLAMRCPRCAPGYLARVESLRRDSTRARSFKPSGNVRSNPVFMTVDRAMFEEGLLIDIRTKVLARLAADERFSALATE